MELRNLRYFLAVAETRHFGRAAEQLHMAQPPLSQAIRRPEADLGVALFTRDTRNVALTGAGEVFRADVERILMALDEAAARVSRFASGTEGILRMGLTGSPSLLPVIARLVKDKMPLVKLEVHSEMLTPALEASLTEHRLDVGILMPPVRHEGIAHRGIAREPLVVVVSDQHWLAGADVVRIEQLRQEDFIMVGSIATSTLAGIVVRSCLAAGFYPNCAYEVAETSAVLGLAAADLGVAIVPESIRATPRPGLQYKDIQDAPLVEHDLAWREDDDSPLLRKLLEVLGESLAPPEGAE